MVKNLIISLLAGYLIGTISTGYIVGRLNNMDIRDYGSGNAGTTNAFRTMGKKAGIITFIGDFMKALIPLVLMRLFVLKNVDYGYLAGLIFGLGCVLGHNYPVWLKFKGGKGIAVTGGVFVALQPEIILPGALVFGGLIFLTRYVSVGSIALSILFPVWLAIFRSGEPYYGVCVAVACCYTLSAVWRHRSNIVRLINGTENKVGQHVEVTKHEE